MKELVIISGKGGTGKTSLVSAFASLARNKVLCDADVDAADLHLITAPMVKERHDFQGGRTAIIQKDKCTECGVCQDLCKWDAISDSFEVDSIGCEGCGICVYFCPEKAIDFPLSTCGEWFISETTFGPMVHARLGIAEENSGKLVSLVRQEARKIAERKGLGLILTDGPPGVGCPVIAADCESGPREILAPNTEEHVRLEKGWMIGQYGILTAVGDTDALAEAVTAMLDDKQLSARCKNAGRIRALDFSNDIIMEQYEKVLYR